MLPQIPPIVVVFTHQQSLYWPVALLPQTKTMRKLKLEVQLSLDGYLANEDGQTNWMIWNWGSEWSWDDELKDYHTELTQSTDCILLSRKMAVEGFVAHWKNTAADITNPQYTFANHIVRTQKVVFSTTLSKSDEIPGGWETVELCSSNIAEKINHLKKQAGKDMIAYGGASFIASLVKENLIDEYHLLINPVVLGKGVSFFTAIECPLPLRLVSAKAFESGMALLNYRPL